jgi:hypothetical protein
MVSAAWFGARQAWAQPEDVTGISMRMADVVALLEHEVELTRESFTDSRITIGFEELARKYDIEAQRRSVGRILAAGEALSYGTVVLLSEDGHLAVCCHELPERAGPALECALRIPAQPVTPSTARGSRLPVRLKPGACR